MADGFKGSIKQRTRSTDIKVLSDVPAIRIACVFLLFAGGVLAIAPCCASNRDEIGAFGLGAFILLGTALIVAGMLLGNRVKRVDVIFDRISNELYVKRKGWFETKEQIAAYDVKNIKLANVLEKHDSDGDLTYQLQLVLKDGSTVSLSSAFVYGRSQIDLELNKLNDIVNNGGGSLRELLEKDRKQKQIPKPVLFAIAAVVLLPFASDWFAHAQELPRVEVQAGVPSPELAEHVQQISHGTLPSGDELLWVGQPEIGHEYAVKGPWVIPFAIIWTLFSLAWTSLAVIATWPNRFNPISWLMPLFGVPFIAIGFGLLLLPYFSYKSDLQTVYVITDQGAYRITEGVAKKIVSFGDNDFGPVEVKPYSSSRADVMFVKNSRQGDTHPYGGFYGIKDADTAAAILKSHSAH